MLTLLASDRADHCGATSAPSGMNFARRDFLRVGSAAALGATLPWLAPSLAGAKGPDYLRDKTIVFLFLCGGPSHIETFDPNMDAPDPRRSMIGEIKTSLPGVTFGTAFPRLAALAHRLAVVRSYSPHGISDHALAIRHVFTAANALGLGASHGAIVTRLAGARMQRGMPPFAEIVDDETDSQYVEDMERMRASNSSGALGPACSPFVPSGAGELQRSLSLNVSLEQLDDRRKLLRSLDDLRQTVGADPSLDALDEFQRQAVEAVLGGAVRKALDLSQEDPRTVARYDTSHMLTGHLERRPSLLGRNLLLARRLAEAGCRFVTVGMAGWDNHGNGNHPGVALGMERLGGQLDHGLSVFLEDVRSRGLTDKILLVMTGEFGRTPTIQAQGGRDHWPGMCSLLFAGGGLKMGQVIGRMARTADTPATDPIRLEHLTATMLHGMFDIGRLRLDRSLPQDLLRLVERASPIEALF